MENQDKNEDLTVSQHYYTCTNIAHLFWLLSLLGPQGTVFPTGIQTQPIKAVSLTDEMKKIKNIGENERKGREILYTQESKTFLKGFWVPYTWGNLYVLVSEH